MYSLNDTSPRALLDAPSAAGGASASLTYEPFYGLREKPFSLSADPRFLFRSPAHGPAFDALQLGIRRREGLIVLTGEIGTGKTTLCRSVLQHLDRRTFASFVADPFVSREDLLKTLLVDFGVISMGDLTRGRFSGASRSDLSYPLYEFLDSLVPLQAFAVVVIDEAQNLSLPLLEEIRILSELERREKLLQVVLVGQPELRANLLLPQMRQVDQRVSVRCELTSLDADGVAGYVNHRLRVAGFGESRVELTPGALDAICRGSSGVPRLINRICDRALQHAYVARSLRIEAHFVWEAIADLGMSPAGGILHLAPRETAPLVLCPAPSVEAPAQPSAPAIAEVMCEELEAAGPALADFAPEVIDSIPDGAAIAPSGRRLPWAAALASSLAVSAALGGFAWYATGDPIDGNVVAALLPSRPAQTLSPPTVVLPDIDAALLASSPDRGAVPGSAIPPNSSTSAPVSAPAVAPARGGYTIMVAAFTSRNRAEHVVEELTDAGFGARSMEIDGGPARGRLVQVMVSGYTSAIDVQRALQHIRELPGGYGDARVVAQ